MMLIKLLIAWCLMAVCVCVHAAGVTSALRWLPGQQAKVMQFSSGTWLFIRLAGWMVLFHLFEISVWAFFYAWSKSMADLNTAFYFSAVTYTTTGYGDLVLPKDYRFLGGVEALTGVLMCG